MEPVKNSTPSAPSGGIGEKKNSNVTRNHNTRHPLNKKLFYNYNQVKNVGLRKKSTSLLSCS